MWQRMTALLLAAACLGWAVPAAADCQPKSLERIDNAWGGTKVSFDSVENRNFIYLGYYDAERWLSVAQVSKCDGTVKKVRLASQFGGWDAHNFISLSFDAAGRLHVSGNMHVTPLVYARMDAPDVLDGLRTARPMVGRDEDRTTYPKFFRFPDGALGFAYRSGSSSRAQQYINRFDGERWERWTDTPLFGATDSKQQIGAYPTEYEIGPDGFFHVAWVWRGTNEVETNFNVNYAKSRDLRNWVNNAGAKVALPMTPESAVLVDAIPVRSGLFNSLKIGFDPAGKPVISYLKFDQRGMTQLFHARPEGPGWQITKSTDWSFRWDPRGVGTIAAAITFSGVELRRGALMELVKHPESGTKVLEYDLRTLQAKATIAGYPWQPSPSVKRDVVRGATVNVRPLRRGDDKPSACEAFSWLSHPPDNRDLPRSCSPSQPLRCDYASEIRLHVDQACAVTSSAAGPANTPEPERPGRKRGRSEDAPGRDGERGRSGDSRGGGNR